MPDKNRQSTLRRLIEEKIKIGVEQILNDRFDKDSLMALATVVDGIPSMRPVDSYYDNHAFYVLTHALSNKMQQIAKNPIVAISGEWFSAHAIGVNMSWFGAAESSVIAQKMRTVFASWIDNGHNDFNDKNTCILRLDVTDGILFENGVRYEIDFRK
jgi:general stress protein 26